MAGLSDEDYWDESRTKLCFGEIFGDENSGSNIEKIEIKIRNEYKSYAPLENVKTPTEDLIPICDLLSDKARKKYLEDYRQKYIQHEAGISTIEETINNILLDKPYDFKNFRSLSSKINLLDHAIKMADGNCLLTILLFIEKTVKPNLFYDVLKTRPVAFDHYVGYLTMKQNTNGLTDLSAIKGHNSVIGLKLYKILVKYFSNKETVESLKRKLQKFHHPWFDYTTDENDGQIIKHYLNFLDWIKPEHGTNNVLNITVNNILRSHCEKYWNLPENHQNSPHTLAKQQNVTNRQLHWILLDTKAAQQQWDDVLKTFIKTNWFGNKKVNNSLIHVENIVIRLGEKNAPSAVLEKFLNMMDDTAKSVNLAIKFKCHRHVIYVYEKEGDRQALEKYKNKIPAQSEDYFFAENSLRSIKIKWKN